jgi:predicted RNA binding protein YcfA (HicA-like mRNA interferase family)
MRHRYPRFAKLLTIHSSWRPDWERWRAAGSHEIWFNPALNRYTTIPNHPGDMPEGTLRAILKQAGISTETFLNKNKK